MIRALIAVVAVGTVAVVAAPASVPSSLVGTWTRNVTAADWTKANSGGFPTGTWKLVVTNKGWADVYVPGGTSPDFSPPFMTSGAKLTIGAVPVCPGTKGRYRWSLAGRVLHITLIADASCGPRRGLFVGAWKRK